MLFNRSIILKLALPVPAIILASLVIAYLVLPGMVMKTAQDAAANSAVQTAEQFKVIRGYYTKNIIKKVKANGSIKPAIDHAGKPNTIPLPATLIHDVSALLAKKDTKMKLYSAFPFPNRKARVLDDFQNSAWAFLSKNPGKVFKRKEVHNGKTVMRVAIADKMTAKGCVSCHNAHPMTPKNDWNLGDVRGVLEIDANITGALAAASSLKNKIMLGISAIGLLLLAMVYFSAKTISGPIVKITQTMKNISEGNLTEEFPNQNRRDEIGDMSRALKGFQQNLLHARELESEKERDQKTRDAQRIHMESVTADFASSITAVVETVASASSELNVTAQSMAGISERTSQQAQDVRDSSSNTSDSVQSVAGATEEMSSSIAEISQQVSQATTASRQAVEDVEKTGRQLEALAGTADKINDVVRMISDIAEQTNLLALNATIESARAGEAGKGFAVVASEVKTLANQTAKATEVIGQQINELQDASRQSVSSMDEITNIINQVNEAQSAIAAAIEEQSAVTSDIAANIDQAAIGTGEVTSKIDGLAQTAQEAGSASGHVMSTSGELAEQSKILRVQVKEFIASVKAG